MTTISSIAQSAIANPAITGVQSGMGQEFNSFIKLLTAQVRNQDPLSPMDSTQFVQQLATFSSLEQQVKSNTSLTSIAAMMSQLNALTAGEWLGQDISFTSSWIPLGAEPTEFSYIPPDGTEATTLTIRDVNGTAIWSETLDPSNQRYSWNGRSSDGTTAPRGAMYEYVIESYKDGELLVTGAPRIQTTATDIISEDGRLRIGTAAGLTIDLAQVRKESGQR